MINRSVEEVERIAVLLMVGSTRSINSRRLHPCVILYRIFGILSELHPQINVISIKDEINESIQLYNTG